MSSIIFRSISSVKCRNPSAISIIGGKYYSTATNAEANQPDDIVIPQRIHRSPTDILKAIESTIQRDPTAAHYKYHDDPYLIPMSNYKKRVYALAQESGRKAAKWILQEHKNLFLYRVSDPPLNKLTAYENADPPIQAYIPRTVYNEKSEVTEKDLLMAIDNYFVKDAITIYNLMASKDSLSQDTQQKFLELLCFFNEADPLPIEWLEEKWFRQGGLSINNRVKNWKNNGLATTLFSNLKEKTPSAYCAIIQGMCKHYNGESAYNLYLECCDNKIPLNVNVYNGLLSVIGFLKEDSEMQWQLIKDLLNDMKSQNISPNLGTLNSILESLSFMESKFAQQHCTEILAEFVKECGIEPSLATWAYVLTIYYKERGMKSNVLYSIMNKIEGQSFTIRDPRDTLFFVTAMSVCRSHLQDIKLCYSIQDLLLHDSNYDLIGDSYRENIYYRQFFSVISRNESLENLMVQYNNLVPHVYVPEPSVMQEILRTIDLNVACDYYPLIWSNIVMFGMTTRQTLVQFLLQSMVRNIPPGEPEKIDIKSKEDSKSTLVASDPNAIESLSALSVEENFSRVAWDIWLKFEEKSAFKPDSINWTAGMLSDIIMLLSRGGKVQDAYTIVQRLSKLEGSIGVPSSPDPLIYFAKVALQGGFPSFSSVALKYLSNCGYSEASDVAVELLQTMLNRPKSEIEELASEAAKGDINTWTADTSIMNLVAIVNQNKSLEPVLRSKASSSSSSESDSSDSDDDEELSKK
ncbi:small ribosomal subunit protein mS39 [Arctopsyche grandis]|uniref:small ribosomal subunit protein mS39 n=1 Tax=Arctopsyche grandis TaxID=121162 RepID=UPI00406DA43E